MKLLHFDPYFDDQKKNLSSHFFGHELIVGYILHDKTANIFSLPLMLFSMDLSK